MQAYILDGANVIDYVQFRDPQGFTNLDVALSDPNYTGTKYYMWANNGYGGQAMPTMGVVDQLTVSENYQLINNPGVSQTPGNNNNSLYGAYNSSSASLFQSFMNPRWLGPGPLTHQAPYTPSRTVYAPYLLQANDPLVHYLASDMNPAVNAKVVWGNGTYQNAIWQQSDDPTSQAMPTAPSSALGPGGRYQPWGVQNGQMAGLSGGVDANVYNLAYKDPGITRGDFWDFPTSLYPTVGWLGRVHRGTPWQTVYLKSTNIVNQSGSINGSRTWANWTGNLALNAFWPYNSQYFDAYNSNPQQDYLLFDIFTTRVNDNAARGTLPVNVGMGQKDGMGRPNGGWAAWSALFSGMVALTNSGGAVAYTNLLINPAGVDVVNSPLWQIVNGPYGINATRTNTAWFTNQAFTHVGQILATPALSTHSPFLNLSGTLNDEEYEWLPQQMMGLVRGTEQRYVLYCWGQALRPAPGGKILGGPFSQMVTNYQVKAESVVRAVVRVDNANTTQPHAVIESYNVLPPN